ncbi:peptidoglycan DD-metalloendopeptidase family protein [Paenibacillus sp. GYB004]|uniref:peptidoglycan DD-metalloendopeptidase family protein n=1 Tax=Paenibacillus sp. GYB004 TaxID=2994393 RepID=UPI002F96287C
MKSGLQYVVNATEIRVQDQLLAIVASEAEAAQILERVVSMYEKEGTQKGTFVESVTSQNVQVSPDQVVTSNRAFEQLTQVQKPIETYVVEEGDTLWDISLKKNVPFDDLILMNPNAGDFLKAGQAVIISPEKRLLNVRAEGTKVEQVSLPFKTVYKTDKSGKEKDQEGKEGIKEISYTVTIENGVEVARSITNEKLITLPVDRIRIKMPPVQIASAPTSKKSDETEVGNNTFLWPADGGKVTSGYGYRGKEFHQGLDIAGGNSLNIRAGAAGEVIFAGWKGDYGNLVILSHDNGLSTYYAHNKELLVSKGDHVQSGDTIAIMGSTGESTGIHVHFEVRKNGKAVNPNAYLEG